MVPGLEGVDFHILLGGRLGIRHHVKRRELVREVVGRHELILDHDGGARRTGRMGIAEGEVAQRPLAGLFGGRLVGTFNDVRLSRFKER